MLIPLHVKKKEKVLLLKKMKVMVGKMGVSKGLSYPIFLFVDSSSQGSHLMKPN